MKKKLLVCKAKRINQLLYCVRLRAMIMPLRYQVLHDLQSFSTNPRQPVPQEFQGGTPEQANAFFEDLVQVAHLQHKNFVAMLGRAVEVFSFAGNLKNHKWQKHLEVYMALLWLDSRGDNR